MLRIDLVYREAMEYRTGMEIVGRCPECGRATIVERLVKEQPLVDPGAAWDVVGWVCTSVTCVLRDPGEWPMSGEPLPL